MLQYPVYSDVPRPAFLHAHRPCQTPSSTAQEQPEALSGSCRMIRAHNRSGQRRACNLCWACMRTCIRAARCVWHAAKAGQRQKVILGPRGSAEQRGRRQAHHRPLHRLPVDAQALIHHGPQAVRVRHVHVLGSRHPSALQTCSSRSVRPPVLCHCRPFKPQQQGTSADQRTCSAHGCELRAPRSARIGYKLS